VLNKQRTLLLTILIFIALTTCATFAFVFLQEKQVKGQIIDATSGEPIPSATLEVGSVSLFSDNQGQFAAYIQQNENVVLRAAAPGYLPARFTFDIPWYLKIGQVDVEMAPMGFTGYVVDAWSAKPLKDVAIRIDEQTIHTDSAGKANLGFTELEMPTTISIAHPGYLPWGRELTRLPQDSTESPLLIRLEPQTLVGWVQSADDQHPLSGVTVKAGNITTQSNGEGHFVLSRLIPNTEIIFQPDDRFQPVSLTFHNQLTATILLKPKGLTVTVRNGLTGSPLAGADVQSSNKRALTDEQGQVQLTRLSPQGIVQVQRAGYVRQTLSYSFQKPMTVSLEPNAMQGTIRDAVTGQALTGAQILLNGAPQAIEGNARYALDNLKEPFTLTLTHSGYKTIQLTSPVTGADLSTAWPNVKTQPCQSEPEDDAPFCLDLLLEPFAARAIYIPFGFLSKKESVLALLDLVDRTELNAVVLDVKSDDGKLAWDTQVEQADWLGLDSGRDDWMSLSDFLAEAKAREIYTIGRMVIFKDSSLAYGRPDLALLYADGTVWADSSASAWVNPFLEEVWDYNIALGKEVAALGFDEINLDYIRFPSDGYLGGIYYAQENTVETRTAAIRAFAARMDEALEPSGVAISADVFGLTVWVEPENDMNIGQRIIDIAPYVDYIAPMIYPSTFIPGNLGLADPSASPYEVIYHSQIEASQKISTTAKVRPWLQAYWYSAEEMLLQKQAANDANSAGWIWWNAGGVYDEAIFNTAATPSAAQSPQ